MSDSFVTPWPVAQPTSSSVHGIFPGKNTGVVTSDFPSSSIRQFSCFPFHVNSWQLAIHLKILIIESHSVVSDSLRPHGLYRPWNSPGQNTGVGSYFLPKGIFPTQRLNPGLSHCRRILYHLSQQGSPKLIRIKIKTQQKQYRTELTKLTLPGKGNAGFPRAS